MAPSDFQLFTYMKKWSENEHFEHNFQNADRLTTFQVPEFYAQRISELVKVIYIKMELLKYLNVRGLVIIIKRSLVSEPASYNPL